MSDPVAEKSSFLKMYMSSHPDTLVGYAKWYGKVAEPITSAEMSAIDSKVLHFHAHSAMIFIELIAIKEHDADLHPQERVKESGRCRPRSAIVRLRRRQAAAARNEGHITGRPGNGN
jgi:hypothetical protein